MNFIFKGFPSKEIGFTCSKMVSWLIFLFLHPGESVKSLIFKPNLTGKIAHAILETPTVFPETFTICSSFKEHSNDEASFFTIFGESNKPWMTLSIWYDEIHIKLWLAINTDWTQIRLLPLHWIKAWNHVCIFTDTLARHISISLNGETPSSFIITGLGEGKPKNLRGKLYIGLSEDNWNGQKQFDGEVANFNIFSGNQSKNIRNMSANPCTYTGDIVYYDSQWDRKGLVEEKNTSIQRICNSRKTNTLPITTRMNWETARKVCDKLGGGNITEAMNVDDLELIILNFKDLNSSCEGIWTPLVYDELDGLFKSSVTGRVPEYLPWLDNYPIGGHDRNQVAIRVVDKSYFDISKRPRYCAVCDVHKSTIFSPIGVCDDSYFGNHIFSPKPGVNILHYFQIKYLGKVSLFCILGNSFFILTNVFKIL